MDIGVDVIRVPIGLVRTGRCHTRDGVAIPIPRRVCVYNSRFCRGCIYMHIHSNVAAPSRSNALYNIRAEKVQVAVW